MNESRNQDDQRLRSLLPLQSRRFDDITANDPPDRADHDKGSHEIHDPRVISVDFVVFHDFGDAESRGDDYEKEIVGYKKEKTPDHEQVAHTTPVLSGNVFELTLLDDDIAECRQCAFHDLAKLLASSSKG